MSFKLGNGASFSLQDLFEKGTTVTSENGNKKGSGPQGAASILAKRRKESAKVKRDLLIQEKLDKRTRVNKITVARYNIKHGTNLKDQTQILAIKNKADAAGKSVIIRNDFSNHGEPYCYTPDGVDGSDLENYLEDSDDPDQQAEDDMDDEEWEAHLKAIHAKQKKKGETDKDWSEVRKILYDESAKETTPKTPEKSKPKKEKKPQKEVLSEEEPENTGTTRVKIEPSLEKNGRNEPPPLEESDDDMDTPVEEKKRAVPRSVPQPGPPRKKARSGIQKEPPSNPNPFMALFG